MFGFVKFGILILLVLYMWFCFLIFTFGASIYARACACACVYVCACCVHTRLLMPHIAIYIMLHMTYICLPILQPFVLISFLVARLKEQWTCLTLSYHLLSIKEAIAPEKSQNQDQTMMTHSIQPSLGSPKPHQGLGRLLLEDTIPGVQHQIASYPGRIGGHLQSSKGEVSIEAGAMDQTCMK